MVRFGYFLILMAAVVSATPGDSAWAQTGPDEAPVGHSKGKIVPPAVSPAPFSTDASNREAPLSVEFRSAAQMTEKDRVVAADAESSVAEHAVADGFAFEQGKWSYQQVMCPALPNHLFLQYTRNNGVGDVTMFMASIPAAAKAGCGSSQFFAEAIRSSPGADQRAHHFPRLITSGRKRRKEPPQTGLEMGCAMPPSRVHIRKFRNPMKSWTPTGRRLR